MDFAEEAWDNGHGVDLLVWVTASSRDAIVAELAQAGAEVCGADPSNPQQAARTFLAWLRTGKRRWLIVLDDVADPADLAGLWPPAAPSLLSADAPPKPGPTSWCSPCAWSTPAGPEHLVRRLGR